MGLILATAPAIEPITLAQARAHLRMDDDVNEEDALITALIVAARELAEVKTGRALVTQEWSYVMDDFPRARRYGEREHREFRLPKSPLQSVESITYKANDGTTATFAADQYVVDTASITGRIALVDGACWPSDVACQANAVTVSLTAGYGDDASDVPAGISQAMLLLIGHWYETREAVNIGNTVNALPFAVDALLSAHRVVEF